MPSIVQLHALLLLALVTLALAAPSRHTPIQKRSFKVERVPNPAFKGRTPGAGTRALVKAHRKYGVALPPGLVDAMNAAAAEQAATAVPGLKSADLASTIAGLDALLGGGDAAKKGADPAAAAPEPVSSTGAAPKAEPKPKATHKPKAGGNSTAPVGAAGNSTGTGRGIVTATPEKGDVEYLSPIQVGGQTMNMDFDSGSSDLWLFNTQLSAASQAGHTNYDPTKSKTFALMKGASYSISYGDGSGSAGNVGTDTVNIGGATVTSQAIELATAVSASFVQDANSNGLVGLAFSQLNTVKPQKQKTFFDNAMPTLAQPVFTADLRSNAVGAYEFGNIDSSKFNGSLSWAAINTTQGFWQFSSQKFAVGTGAPMMVAGGQAIADTGTTLMLANAAIVNAYYSQVNGAVNNATVGGVTFPCNSQLPDLAVDIGGSYMATVQGSDINFAAVDATGASKFS